VHDHGAVRVRREVHHPRFQRRLRIRGGIGGCLELRLLVDGATEIDGTENAEHQDETEDRRQQQRLPLLATAKPPERRGHGCAHLRKGLDCIRIV
jgi:hypothetical protein